MLNENPIYANAGAIAVSRHTYKNQGIERLLPGESLLGTQTLRGYMHVFQGEKFEWTKTIVHTKRRKGWIFPGPHVLMHQEFGMEEAGMIDAMAQPLGEILRTRIVAENDPLAVAGDFWYGGKIPHRIYEPLVRRFVALSMDQLLIISISNRLSSITFNGISPTASRSWNKRRRSIRPTGE